jgi:hypothetical protein
LKIAYFVHDLTDPAVARRVRMFRAGGAEVTVLGFRREPEAPTTVQAVPAIDLGRTFDGRLGHRAAMTLRAAASAGRLRRTLGGADVIVARTLEMLAVAAAARPATARLVYECLDIHRLMLGEGAASRGLRLVERMLMRRADLLVVSSPAFLSNYFAPRQGVGRDLKLEALLVENKVLELDGESPNARAARPPGPPWRIGWMGALRCRRSLGLLADLARRRPDLVEVRLHGRPAYGEFDDFDAEVSAAPNLSFGGSYTAGDLPRLYGEVHFSWAIDFMEEGLNSAWLLPNRLYEASRHGAVPIALAGVETGRYLAEGGFGLRLERAEDLERALEALTPEAYAGLRRRLAAMPDSRFAAGPSDCVRLVEVLAGERAPAGPPQGRNRIRPNARMGQEHYQGEAV